MLESISTKRCRLVPVENADTLELHSLWTLPQVRRFLWDDEVIPLATTEEIVSKSVRYSARREFGLWLVHLKSEEELIGFGGYWPFHDPPRIELLFGLNPSYWRQGYATEFATALVQYGFEVLSFESILASTDAPNRASIAVLARLGMIQTEFQEKTGTCFFELAKGKEKCPSGRPVEVSKGRKGSRS